ncbi:MAG: hypothetical protein WBG17_01265 [Burkholderiaceae bacterium]
MPSIRSSSLPAVALAIFLSVLLAACGGGSDNPGPAPATVQLSGKITYDFVPAVASQNPQGAWSGGLVYTKTIAKPARGVQVEAVADDGSVLAATQAGADGAYTLVVPSNTSVRLRAKARLLRAPGTGPSWDFSVRDNTSAGYASGNAALYAVQGDAFNSGRDASQTRDLNAASGWTGSGYGKARAAAPFAILDQFYSAIQKVLAADGQATFAPMNTYWSVNNRPASGDPALGEIGTSHWSARDDQPGDRPGLYILGAENVDTDEYDTGVVVHEWGHYFESRFSRADSTGGPHGGGELLDMRLAFGEAWGNSLAGMVRDDPLYVDTNSTQQARVGVVLDLDTIPGYEPRGWFNEGSVQYVLYQLYKTPTIGFPAIYKVMVGPQKTTEAFTSLFSFATYLRAEAGAEGKTAIDQLLAGINTVNGADLDIWGSKQTYPSILPAVGEPFVLPVYTQLSLGTPVTVCRTADFGTVAGWYGNKLGNIRYLRLPITQAGTYKLQLTSNPSAAGKILAVYRSGQAVLPMNEVGAEVTLPNLSAGDYAASLSSWSTTPNACFTVTLVQ